MDVYLLASAWRSSKVRCGGKGCDAFRGRRQANAEGTLNAEPEERSVSSADPV
jgi:hypothetical protein